MGLFNLLKKIQVIFYFPNVIEMSSITDAVFMKNTFDTSIDQFAAALASGVLWPEARKGKNDVYLRICFPLSLKLQIMRHINTEERARINLYDVGMNLECVAEKLKNRGFSVTLSPSLENTEYKNMDPWDLCVHVYMVDGQPRSMDPNFMNEIWVMYNRQDSKVSLDMHVSWKTDKTKVEGEEHGETEEAKRRRVGEGQENGEDLEATGEKKAEEEEHEEDKAKRRRVGEDKEHEDNTVTGHEDDI